MDFRNTDTSSSILIEVYAIRILQFYFFNPSNATLNPICHLLALLGAHHILHVSGLMVNNYFNNILSPTLVLPRFGVPSCLPTKMCIPHKNKQDFQIQENINFCDKLILHLEVLGLNLGRKHYPDFVFVQF